ncbi:MAG TPA: sensor histidine kinase [Puia sp.]|jgi:two-component system LytT family sensor kinase|nr:sensor histidine kinase [Puia sp.]
MEYDNDRIVKGTHKSELYCWLIFAIINPLVNSLGIFPHQKIAWIVLIVIAMLLLPLYMLYSRLIVIKFLFKKKYLIYGLLTVLFYSLVLTLLLPLYEIAQAIVRGPGQYYFSFSTVSIVRETVWILINICLTIAISWYRRKLDEEEAMEALQKENTYYKLRYFRTQLNPHFLFNTLNSIYSLSLSKADKTPEVVIRLSDIMRFLIYECNEDKIPLEKEIEFIRNYIEIERIRYDADIQFTVEGSTEGVMIEPFLFISFIENGFKHAIDHSFAKPFIYITLKVSPDQIALNVINNTSLELETQARKIQGKGLLNSKSVLELLYPDAYALDIIQTEKKERKESKTRLKNAQERLQRLYPDTHTLDIILNNNTFTVSLILITGLLDKMYHNRR